MSSLASDSETGREAGSRYRPPRPRGGTIRRERLFLTLDGGMAGRLMAVSAPAGFGKTTLLADWLTARKRHSCWLTITPDIADDIGFVRALVGALAELGAPNGRAPYAESGDGGAELAWFAARPGLMAALSAGDEYGRILVLDDAHLLGPGARAILQDLLRALPAGVTILASGRSRPRVPLARMRANGDLAELEARDLRFNLAETREFLLSELGPERADEDLGLFAQKTEGWAAALRIAALGLRDKPDLHEFLSSFSGARREIFDFFAEEALSSLEPDILDFLLRCSPLETLSGPLCEAATGRHDAEEILRRLEEDGLFLTSQDEERRRYAFHGLFRDALYRQFEAEKPAEIAGLRLRAADHLAAEGRYIEAMRLRLMAGDAEGAALLAEGWALAALERSRISELREAIAGLPPQAVASRPWLAVAAAWTAVYAGRLDDAAPPKEIPAGKEEPGQWDGPRILGHFAAVRAYVANLEGDGEAAVESARRALALLGDEDRMARAHSYKSLGFGLILLHDYDQAPAALDKAIVEARRAGLDHIRYLAALDRAYLAMLRGELDAAQAVCRRELGPPGTEDRASPASGCLHSFLANVSLARGDLETALRESRLGLDLCMAWGNMDRLVFSGIMNVMALAATGSLGTAKARVEWLKSLPSLTPRHSMIIALASADFDPMGPDGRFFERAPTSKDENSDLMVAMVHADILLARRRPAEALAVAEPALERAAAWGHRLNEARLLCSLSDARRMLGRGEAAREAAVRALALAGETGAIQSLLSRGAAFMDYLEAQGLLTGRAGSMVAEAYGRTLRADAADLREGAALSPREREILSCLARGMTAEELAPALFISSSTVRSHVKNIYAKLGAHRRVEAVNKARSLGLL